MKKVSNDKVSVASRTLLAAGYSISGCHRQPQHVEIRCERVSRLGATLRLSIALTDKGQFAKREVEDIERFAGADRRATVLVAASRRGGQISWDDFLQVLGGAIPSWRALSVDYGSRLMTASRNEAPDGVTGEAWLIFEDLVADGLEFLFGRRVQRFGGRRRGQRVSDMVAQIPDSSLIVVDAKASRLGFDASWPSLRPLVEYVKKQQKRQNNLLQVTAALLVSSSYKQKGKGLTRVAGDFFTETRVPLCFATADALCGAVECLRSAPDIRGAVRWRSLFRGGGLTAKDIEQEVNSAANERYEQRDV